MNRRGMKLALAAGLAAIMALLPGVALGLLDTGGLPGTEPTKVEMMPKSLNLRGKGKFTVFIEPGTPQGAAQINPGTVAITAVEGQPVLPVWPVGRPILGDCDENGITDLKLKFSRADLEAVLPPSVNLGRQPVELTIGGQLRDGTPFEGTQTVKIVCGK